MHRTSFRQNKYGAKRTEFDGYKYDSKFEASVAQDLTLRVKAKDIKSFDRQTTLRLDVNGVHICNYKIDFVVHHNDGTQEFLEAKGFETMLWRVKWKLLEALHEEIAPGSIMTVIKQSKYR
jgi:hypothetical protein